MPSDAQTVIQAMPPAWFEPLLEWIALAVEVAGILVIVVGVVSSTVQFLRRVAKRHDLGQTYHAYRTSLARGILLGLEFLVAGDIVGTVAIDPNLDNLAVLAGIVLIRTFLSFSLEVEIEGRWPWQKGR